jgi:2',3'-cyclic-nucleotide 2'-phosphodiesterase (5'-nucleotidase family)
MRYAFLFLFACFLFTCKTTSETTDASLVNISPDFEFVILQMNDVYEISPLDEGRVGGLARVATIRRQLLEANPNVITVLAGDYLNPSLIGSLKCQFGEEKDRVNGRQMVDVMNAMGVDYVTFGNHEFDLGEDDLVARNQESKFKIISGNAFQKTGEGEKAFQQFGGDIPGYAVHEFSNQDGKTFKLGLFGVVLPFNQTEYVAYTDHFEEGKKAYEAVIEESDVAFGLTHLTMGMDEELAGMLPEVPLIMGGHEHVNMTSQVGNTSIIKADANAKTVYIHWCRYNFQTKKTKVWSQLFPVTDVIEADAAVDAVVQKWEQFARECMISQGYEPEERIYYTQTPLDGTEASVRYGETNLGKLIALAFEKAAPTADVALFNSGSIRLDDKLSGYVRQKNILATLPFGGELMQGPIKGSELKKLLDTGLAESLKGNGAYLQLGSIKKEGNAYLIKGKALDLEKTYQVALPGFLAGGGETALSFITESGPFQLADLSQAIDNGLVKNDLRDIVIWSMKQEYDEED